LKILLARPTFLQLLLLPDLVRILLKSTKSQCDSQLRPGDPRQEFLLLPNGRNPPNQKNDIELSVPPNPSLFHMPLKIPLFSFSVDVENIHAMIRTCFEDLVQLLYHVFIDKLH